MKQRTGQHHVNGADFSVDAAAPGDGVDCAVEQAAKGRGPLMATVRSCRAVKRPYLQRNGREAAATTAAYPARRRSPDHRGTARTAHD